MRRRYRRGPPPSPFFVSTVKAIAALAALAFGVGMLAGPEAGQASVIVAILVAWFYALR